jgi:hypothetical protein
MEFIQRCTAIVTLLMGFSVAGVAGQFSFTGNFVNDNDVQLFSFTLLSPGTVTVQTWGYGGGTNAAGQVIAPGGFEPTLSMFDALSGNLVAGPFDPGGTPCAPRNVDPTVSLCQDAYGQHFLSAGNYFLSLTQSPNGSVSTNLSDGFVFTDANANPDPNFNNHFFSPLSNSQRDSHWAVDILFVDAASEVGATPEPTSAALVAGAAVLAGLWRRRLTRN